MRRMSGRFPDSHICGVEGCANPAPGRTMCDMHRQRASRCRAIEGASHSTEPRLLLNMHEIAEASNVSLSVVRRWVAAGYLKPVELPLLTRRKLFRRDDVLAFIASCPTKTA